MRLALIDLYQAKWSQEIHNEWIKNLLKNRPDLEPERVASIRFKMDQHVRDCLVEGYEELIKGITLPDPNDRHVLAAAIKANAQTIVTYNLSDFPAASLSKYGVEAQHPDDFLRFWLDQATAKVIKIIRETRQSLRKPPKTPSEYLAILEGQSLPRTCACLREYIDFL